MLWPDCCRGCLTAASADWFLVITVVCLWETLAGSFSRTVAIAASSVVYGFCSSLVPRAAVACYRLASPVEEGIPCNAAYTNNALLYGRASCNHDSRCFIDPLSRLPSVSFECRPQARFLGRGGVFLNCFNPVESCSFDYTGDFLQWGCESHRHPDFLLSEGVHSGQYIYRY